MNIIIGDFKTIDTSGRVDGRYGIPSLQEIYINCMPSKEPGARLAKAIHNNNNTESQYMITNQAPRSVPNTRSRQQNDTNNPVKDLTANQTFVVSTLYQQSQAGPTDFGHL